MKQELFEKGVKAAIADILERSLNKWVSVMEPGASFGAILTKNGISPKVSPALFKVLSSVGIIQREGVKSTIRYRYVPTSVAIPDLDKLAAQVWLENQDYSRAKRATSRQKHVTPPCDVNQNGKATRLKGNLLPNVGDSRYILSANEGVIEIIEVKVVGVMRDPEDGRYAFHVVYRLPEDDELKYMARLPLHDLYARPEDVYAHLSQTIVRFRGELFPTIKRETVKQNGR
jgi:hypothetical protein